MPDKPILCLDFDGVIHSYERGWQGGEIYGELTPGFLDWAAAATKYFTLAVYSSRSATYAARMEMCTWIAGKAADQGWQRAANWWDDLETLRLLHAKRAEIIVLEFTASKPPAWLTIDDRAVTFRGRWDSPGLAPAALRNFQPWMTAENAQAETAGAAADRRAVAGACETEFSNGRQA